MKSIQSFLLLVLLGFSATLSLNSCASESDAEDTDPAANNVSGENIGATGSTPQSNGVPKGKMVWEEMAFDFGRIPQGTPVAHKFNYKVEGGEGVNVTIENVKPSCQCTVADFTKLPVLPGGEGFVEATYNAAKTGRFTKTVTVISDAVERTVVLSLRGEVFDPATEK